MPLLHALLDHDRIRQNTWGRKQEFIAWRNQDAEQRDQRRQRQQPSQAELSSARHTRILVEHTVRREVRRQFGRVLTVGCRAELQPASLWAMFSAPNQVPLNHLDRVLPFLRMPLPLLAVPESYSRVS